MKLENVNIRFNDDDTMQINVCCRDGKEYMDKSFSAKSIDEIPAKIAEAKKMGKKSKKDNSLNKFLALGAKTDE